MMKNSCLIKRFGPKYCRRHYVKYSITAPFIQRLEQCCFVRMQFPVLYSDYIRKIFKAFIVLCTFCTLSA